MRWLLCLMLIPVLVASANPATALEVWTHSPLTFSKSGLPANPAAQDRIKPDVWITRGVGGGGIYNIAPGQEIAYATNSSPLGTRWAFSGLDGNPAVVSANDHATLVFTSWEQALGGQGNLASNIRNRQGVVHLVASDTYIDIRFTSWGMGGSGTFTYVRATAPAFAEQDVPLPLPAILALGGLFVAAALHAQRRGKRMATRPCLKTFDR